MPNPLAHIGIHALTTKAINKEVDLKWIYLGAIIPDLPWILQRIVRFIMPNLDRLDLRLYVIVQASLFFCLILSASFALFSKSPKSTFVVLGSGALLHLLLDALQIKWANGVHLFAPFDWTLINFALVWPESLPTYLVTAFGLFYAGRHWKKSSGAPFPLSIQNKKLNGIGLIFLMLYFFLPWVFFDGPEIANNHYLGTIRSHKNRQGKTIEIDRSNYRYDENGGTLSLLNGETIEVQGINLERSERVSIRGVFSKKDLIQVHEVHVHRPFREPASYLGLAIIASLWMRSGFLAWRDHKRGKHEPRSLS